MRPYSQLVTDTIETNHKTLIDQMFGGKPFMKRIFSKAQDDGGQYILEPVNLGKNPTSGPINPYANFPITNNQKRTKARFDWKTYHVSVELYDYDIWLNKSSSPAKIIDTVGEEFSNAQQSLEEDMSLDMWQAVTTRPLGFVGFQSMFTSTPAVGLYGGISRVEETAWRSQYAAMAALDLDTMYDMDMSCTFGKDEPTVLVTTKLVMRYYNAKLTPIQRINDSKSADSGYKRLMFLGREMMWDDDCPVGRLNYFNENYIKVKRLKGVNFLMRDPIAPVNKAAFVKSIFWTGMIYNVKPRVQGFLDGIVG